MLNETGIIPVGGEPPPLRRPQNSGESTPAAMPGHNGKVKGKAVRPNGDGRFAVLNAFVDFTMAGLNRNEIAVWLVIFRDTRDGTARTGQADIAKRAGMSARTVRRGLKGLQRRGLVKRVHLGGVGRGTSVYQVRPLSPQAEGGQIWPERAVNSGQRRGHSSDLHPIRDQKRPLVCAAGTGTQ